MLEQWCQKAHGRWWDPHRAAAPVSNTPQPACLPSVMTTSIVTDGTTGEDETHDLEVGWGDEVKHFTRGTGHRTLVIVDDMLVTHACLVSAWFMRKSYHFDMSIVHLVQISLNATCFILFKNHRDMSQVSHMDKLVYPGSNGLLTAAYGDATVTQAHSYMFTDFNQTTPKKFHLRNTLFPDEDFSKTLAYGPASQAWEGEVAAGEGRRKGPPRWHKDQPSTAAVSFASMHSPWQQQQTVQQSTAGTPLPTVLTGDSYLAADSSSSSSRSGAATATTLQSQLWQRSTITPVPVPAAWFPATFASTWTPNAPSQGTAKIVKQLIVSRCQHPQ